ncbi:MAG: hypothetical protein ACRDN0_35560 [Trebonia sp.]
MIAVEVNDPAGIDGPGAEFEQQVCALGGGGEPPDGLRVTVSARGGELGGMELPLAAPVRGFDFEEPCAGAAAFEWVLRITARTGSRNGRRDPQT